MLSEITESLHMMVEIISNYNVKRPLLDASSTRVKVKSKGNRAIMVQIAKALPNARLQKVACIQPSDPVTERRAQGNITKQRKQGLSLTSLKLLLKNQSNQLAVKLV